MVKKRENLIMAHRLLIVLVDLMVVVNGVERVVAFVRDAKKVIIKNDMLLSPVDMQHVKLELSKFIKKVEDTKKSKGRK